MQAYRNLDEISGDRGLHTHFINLTGAGRFAEAWGINERRFEVHSEAEEPTAQDFHEYLLNRANLHYLTGDYSAAISDLNEAESLYSDSGRRGTGQTFYVHSLMAVVLIDQERYADAIGALQSLHDTIVANDRPGWRATDLVERLRHYWHSYDVHLYQGHLQEANEVSRTARDEILNWHNTDVDLSIVEIVLSNHARISALLGNFDEADESLNALAVRVSDDPCYRDLFRAIQSMMLAYERGQIDELNSLIAAFEDDFLPEMVARDPRSFLGVYVVYQLRLAIEGDADQTVRQDLIDLYRSTYDVSELDDSELASRFATSLQSMRDVTYPWNMVDQF